MGMNRERTIMNDLLTRILTQADKVMRHIYGLFESIYGYIIFCTVLVTSFISGEKVVITMVLLAIFADFILGVWTSIKQKRFTTSQLIQDTFVKIIVYGVPLLLIGLSENNFTETAIGFYAGCALAIGCELWSILAHLIIIAPNMPFPKILRLQLQDEIKSKTGKDINELTKKEREDEAS